jgi:hypothetical protein
MCQQKDSSSGDESSGDGREGAWEKGGSGSHKQLDSDALGLILGTVAAVIIMCICEPPPYPRNSDSVFSLHLCIFSSQHAW